LTSNITRKRLFEYLGASEADVVTVRESILRACMSASSTSLTDYKAYLRCLYLTHRPGISATTELARVVVVNGQRTLSRPHATDMYLPGKTHPFSPESLLAPNGEAPGLSVTFIHGIYIQNAAKKPIPDHPSWERWLFDFVGIRERLRLVNHSEESLSETVMYVHEHRPDQFLGLLKYLWQDASPEIRANQILRRNMKALPAKDLCGASYAISLGETWLPFKNLRDHVSLYMESPQHFPFLKIDSISPADQFSVEWSFLAEYSGVRKEENLDFYMDILRYIQKSHPKTASVLQGQKIFDLYAAIYAKLTLSRNQLEDQRKIK
jgi:hypothetical protein